MACTHPLLAVRSALRVAAASSHSASTADQWLARQLQGYLSKIKIKGYASAAKFTAIADIFRDSGVGSASLKARKCGNGSDSEESNQCDLSDSSSLDGDSDDDSDDDEGGDSDDDSDEGEEAQNASIPATTRPHRAVIFLAMESKLDIFADQMLAKGKPLLSHICFGCIDSSVSPEQMRRDRQGI